MMNPRTIKLLLCFNALTALGAAAWTLATPSEPGAARLLGYSYARLALAGVEFLLAGLISIPAFLALTRKEYSIQLARRLDSWILTGDRLHYTLGVLLGGWLLAGLVPSVQLAVCPGQPASPGAVGTFVLLEWLAGTAYSL